MAEKLTPPPGTSAPAKTRFNRIVKAGQGRFKPIHADAIAEYCEVCCTVTKLRNAFMKEKQLIVESSNKQKQINPLANALKEWVKLKKEMASELGLSLLSESRAKLEAIEDEEDEEDIDPMHARVKARIK